MIWQILKEARNKGIRHVGLEDASNIDGYYASLGFREATHLITTKTPGFTFLALIPNRHKYL
jgi:hypothetical protein